MNLFKKIKLFVFKHKVWSTIIFLVAAGYASYYFFFRTTMTPTVVYGSVSKKDLMVTVDGSGQLSGTNQMDILPEASGKITNIYVKPGDTVSSGQVLAEIDHETASDNLTKAKSQLASAQLSYNNAEKSLAQTIKEQTNTVHNKEIALNSTVVALPDSGNNHINIVSLSGSYNSSEQGQYTLSTYACQNSVCYSISGLENDMVGRVDVDISKPLGVRGLYFTFTTMPNANEKWVVQVPSPQAPSYTANKTAYTEAVDNKDIAIDNAKSSLENARLSLESSKTNYSTVQRDYDKTYIRAPFAGQVGKVSGQVGANASTGSSFAVIAAPGFSANITLNEVDAAKVKVGQRAIISFDAVPGLTLDGQVSEVDTIGTVSQNVVTFGVKVSFDTKDIRVKPQMSVTVSIVTAEKKEALVVPSAAIKTFGGKNFVEIPSATSTASSTTSGTLVNVQRVPVELGISNDTETEIISGLSEGQRIIVRRSTSGSSTTSGTNTTPSSRNNNANPGASLRRLGV